MRFRLVASACVVLPALVAGCASDGGEVSGFGRVVAATEIDADGDGVPNDADACPKTPAGIAVDVAGCPLFTDADSVPDYLDQCPGTPAGAQVDAKGCPIDSDGDRVADYLDKCTATPPGTPVDGQGCPLGAALSIVTNINFDFDSAIVRDDARPKLDRVVALLRESPHLNVRVVGYTDSTGPAAYNGELSLRRAQAVREYIVSRGIAASRVSARGRGEADPFVPNATREGRAVNRRVEFEVVD